MTKKLMKLGTRRSPLALKQTEMVIESLKKNHENLDIDIVPIKSAADWDPAHGENFLDTAQGGKALFASEIEQALMAGQIDAGVHSLKDMAGLVPQSLCIHHFLARADVRLSLIHI